MQKLKFNQNQILKLNNQTYLPFLIHNLPKKYHTFDTTQILKIKTTIYININQFEKPFINNYINTLNFSNINSNNIK